MSMDNPVELLYSSFTGSPAEVCRKLSPSGSRRVYYRLNGHGSESLIGVRGTDRDENNAFITLSSHLRSKGVNVPEVMAVSSDGMCYLQQDMGDTLLYDVLAEARASGQYGASERELLCRTMASLPKIQIEGARGLDASVCYPAERLNARMVDFDLNYFKYCFLKPTSVEFNEEKLQDDFDKLRADILAEPADAFMYRDFQARNVMLKDGELCFIDFQGGRLGPIFYDVASFVWQARAAYPKDLREEMLDAYLDAMDRYNTMDRDDFRHRLRVFVLFRMLQVLGAYGFRGRIEKRSHFLESIPFAIRNLSDLLSEPFERYPYLSEVLKRLVDDENARKPDKSSDGLLEIHIISFSFKKGIPEDRSGNGGGYVFDCRSSNNPGRYERYRSLTGLDADVKDFLERDGEILAFIDHVIPVVDTHVTRFVERGFTHLQVAFGCTGGQHRSVYSAQRLAEHLQGRDGVRVHLTHRELNIDRML